LHFWKGSRGWGEGSLVLTTIRGYLAPFRFKGSTPRALKLQGREQPPTSNILERSCGGQNAVTSRARSRTAYTRVKRTPGRHARQDGPYFVAWRRPRRIAPQFAHTTVTMAPSFIAGANEKKGSGDAVARPAKWTRSGSRQDVTRVGFAQGHRKYGSWQERPKKRTEGAC